MSEVQPFLDSTNVAGDADEARSRMDRDGYLFVRGLLPTALLEDLRRRFVGVLREAGWIMADARPDEPIANLDAFTVEPEPAYQAVYNRLYKLSAFHAVQHRKELTETMRRLLDAPVMPHPRVIARVMFPKRSAHTTPAHQDFLPVQGAADTITAWIPLSDVPVEMGGLQVAAGSHRRGVFDFVPSLGAGGMAITDPLEGTWRGGPFEQGDALLFHSMTAHRGAAAAGERLRLSIDLRFQRRADPVMQYSLEPHDREISWEDVYADWTPGQHQYYWRDWDLAIVDFDRQYNKKRDSMAFELAAKGDETARAALQRILARDPDPAQQSKAAAALASLDARSS